MKYIASYTDSKTSIEIDHKRNGSILLTFLIKNTQTYAYVLDKQSAWNFMKLLSGCGPSRFPSVATNDHATVEERYLEVTGGLSKIITLHLKNPISDQAFISVPVMASSLLQSYFEEYHKYHAQ